MREGWVYNGKLEGRALFYYENGNIQTELEYSKGKPNGKYIEFYPNGKTKIEAFYKDSLLNGLEIEYYETGTIKTKSYYVNGKREDTVLLFNPKGRIVTKSIFKNGEYIKEEHYDSTGELIAYSNQIKGIDRMFDAKDDHLFYVEKRIDDNYKKLIYFERRGVELLELVQPIDFLTNQDSIKLSQHYPDWQEQIKAWEEKEKGQVNP